MDVVLAERKEIEKRDSVPCSLLSLVPSLPPSRSRGQEKKKKKKESRAYCHPLFHHFGYFTQIHRTDLVETEHLG